MTRPKVSFIVPCYNSEATIERTLQSLQQQTLKDIEVILVNDGSTDHSLEKAEAFQKSHPDFDLKIFTKQNEGIAEARNFGLSKVSGSYFGWLDSDDYTVPQMAEEMYTKAVKENLQLVISDFVWINSRGEKIQKEGPYQTGPDMVVNLFAVLWNKLYKTDFIRSLDIQFPKGNRYEDDCFLYTLAPHVSSIGFMNKPYVHYVQTKGSITHHSNEEVRNMVRVFEIILAYYRSHGYAESYHDALEYLLIRNFLGSNFLRAARIPDAKERKETILLGWNLLNQEFPEWRKNPYLKTMPGLKNRYFRMVNQHNLMFFAWVFRTFTRENL